jgi:alpha-D-ribose 1-methylphosphonate 5-triphosphate synthase subunit PhnG
MNHIDHTTPHQSPAPASTGAADAGIARRRRWLAILARASREELERIAHSLPPQPAWQWMRRPETGLAMLRGRAGGSGARFNLGEASITRCALRTASARTGVAYVLGRDHRRAELAALFDALLQEEAAGNSASHLVEQAVEQLAETQSSRRDVSGRKAAATRVDFYTLVRGEES